MPTSKLILLLSLFLLEDYSTVCTATLAYEVSLSNEDEQCVIMNLVVTFTAQGDEIPRHIISTLTSEKNMMAVKIASKTTSRISALPPVPVQHLPA